MEQITNLQNSLQYLVSSTQCASVVVTYVLGRTLTVFFKRRFSFHEHTGQIFWDTAAVLLSLVLGYFSSSPLTVVFQLLAVLYSFGYRADEKIKTAVLSLSIATVLYGDNIGKIITGEPLTPNNYESLALMVATTQLVRNPEWLKRLLSEPRIICGPMFPIFTSALLRFTPRDEFWLLSIASAFTALLAAMVFRPDNNEVLKVFWPKTSTPSFSTKRKLHGVLMMISCLSLTLMKALKFCNVNSTENIFLFHGLMIGVLDIFLYILYKTVSYAINTNSEAERRQERRDKEQSDSKTVVTTQTKTVLQRIQTKKCEHCALISFPVHS